MTIQKISRHEILAFLRCQLTVLALCPIAIEPCFAEASLGLGGHETTPVTRSQHQSTVGEGIGGRCVDAVPPTMELVGRFLNDLGMDSGLLEAVSGVEREGDEYLRLALDTYRRALSISSSSGCGRQPAVRLGDLVGWATSAHPAVLSRRSELESAGYAVSAARWQYAPSVTASNDSVNGGVGRVEVKQPLWMGGLLSAGVDQAAALHDASRWALGESRLNIAERVIDTYGEWLQNQKKKLSIEQSMVQLNRLYLRILQREASGMANNSEVVLARARLSQASSDLVQTKAALRVALGTLESFAGKPISQDDLVEESAEGMSLDLASIPDRVKAYSPALKRALAAVRVAEAEVDKKRAALSPQASLVWQRTYGDYVLENAPGVERLMLRLEFSSGAGASALSNASGAAAHRSAVIAEAEAVERDLAIRVTGILEGFQSAEGSIKDAAATLGSAREVLASYERQFLAGRRGWLDVMNAVREVDDAQRNLGAIQAKLVVQERKLALYAGSLLKEGAE